MQGDMRGERVEEELIDAFDGRRRREPQIEEQERRRRGCSYCSCYCLSSP